MLLLTNSNWTTLNENQRETTEFDEPVAWLLLFHVREFCGQIYKAFTSVYYYSRVVNNIKLLSFTTLKT